MGLFYLSRFLGRAHALRLWYFTRRHGTKLSQRGYTLATGFVGQCCREMDHFMHRGANRQISLVQAKISINSLFDRLENRDKLLFDGSHGGFMGCAEANGSTSFIAVKRRLTHVRPACVTCYRFLWLSAV